MEVLARALRFIVVSTETTRDRVPEWRTFERHICEVLLSFRIFSNISPRYICHIFQNMEMFFSFCALATCEKLTRPP